MTKREIHTRGVVIARRAAGEGSVRVLLYTEELGLVRAVAKSAREERSKLRPYLIPGTRGAYSLVKGKAEWRVTGVVNARTSYFECVEPTQQQSSTRVVELIAHFVHGEGADPDLFRSLWDYLEALPTLSAADVRIAEYVAVLRILAALGYVAPRESISEFMDATYSAAILAAASKKKRDIVSSIHDGFEASGLN